MHTTTRIMLLLPLLLASAAVTACGEVVTWRVDHYRPIAFGADHACLGLAIEEEGERSNRCGGIEGFDFEWGVVQEIRVHRRHVARPAADASSYEYRLVEVLRREAVEPDVRFTWGLVPSRFPLVRVEGGWDAEGRLLVPADEDVGAALEAAVEQGAEDPWWWSLELGYAGDPEEDPLVVYAVEAP